MQNSCLVDEKEAVPLMNPESAIQGAIKNIKIGGEEWTYKVSPLLRDPPDPPLVNYIFACFRVNGQ